MTPSQYCYQKVAKPNSQLYYCVRQLDKSHRDAVVAIHAFYQEIAEIGLSYTDLQVAQTQFNWWRNQIIQIQEGIPNHPVALALQLYCKNVDSLEWIKIIDAFLDDLPFSVFPTFEDRVIQIMRTAGMRDLLIAKMILEQEPISNELIYQFTLCIELINHLQTLHQDIKNGLIYFSEDELLKFQVKVEDLQRFTTTPAIRNLLTFQAEKAERSYYKVLSELSPMLRHKLRYFVVRCEVALAVLKAIRQEKFCVLEKFIDITPLRCWWIAWWV